MKKISLFLRVSDSKCYNFRIFKNSKYKKDVNKFYVRVMRNFDVRGDIKHGCVFLYNNYFNNFVKCFNGGCV